MLKRIETPSTLTPSTGPDDFKRAQEITQRVPNKGIIICEVMPRLIPIATLFLSSEYDAIPTAQWCTPQLPLPGDYPTYQLYTPKPDLTIGYNHRHLKRFQGLDALDPFSTPVDCRRQLVFPSFSVEARDIDNYSLDEPN